MNRILTALLLLLCLSSFVLLQKEKPTIYIIGDSTVRNGNGAGQNQQWGWGSFIADYFDTNQVRVSNQAIGGRSSRTFLTEGRWERILADLKKGDYVLIQFGHNDSGPLDDTARARGTLRGIGEESKEIFNPKTSRQEVVHTYGWYLRKYVRETLDKGAIPIVCSPIPRNQWKEGRVARSADSYGGWAEAVVREEPRARFISLNEIVAARYEQLGPEVVKTFFPADHTHTNKEGAELNAKIVVAALDELKLEGLNRFRKK